MSEIAINFRASQAKVILAGAKTQTRRVMRDQPNTAIAFDDAGNGEWVPVYEAPNRPSGVHGPVAVACPYGKPGDRLWVREPHRAFGVLGGGVQYCADNTYRLFDGTEPPEVRSLPVTNYWRSPNLMPRWAGRIALEVTGTRIDRLRDITAEDAIAEGVNPAPIDDDDPAVYKLMQREPTLAGSAPKARFAMMWDSMFGHKRPGVANWNANPWVWVIAFKLIEQEPIDEQAARKAA